MKILADFCKKELRELKEAVPIICDYFMTPWGPSLLKEPINSLDYECSYCSGKGHYTPYVDPTVNDKRAWLCENTVCEVYSNVKTLKATTIQPTCKRSIEWASWCELNGIGDVHHDVKFEKIEQSAGKIDYLFKFAAKPRGLIFMQGIPGGGKTYASLGVCEFFTRKSESCVFIKQNTMQDRWSSEEKMLFISRLKNVNLLVIDDFGTGEVPSGFMKFFLDVIDSRMQWTDRGTIITTNLNDRMFLDYCGTPLNDRIKTGQKFEFKDVSRRKPIIL